MLVRLYGLLEWINEAAIRIFPNLATKLSDCIKTAKISG